MKPRAQPKPPPALITLLIVTGAMAAIGGLAMLISNGRALGLELSTLEASPFASYRVPGLVLAVVIGGSQLAAAAAMLKRRKRHLRLGVLAAVLLGGWLAIQVLMIGTFWLQLVMALVALVELGLIASTLPRETAAPSKKGRRRR